VSPIFVRPVREQLEHDRLIRHLVLKYKRKFDAVGNVGDEQLAPVKLGTGTYYPDLVLMEGKKLAAVIEVETAESVNNLEAMAQWVPFSRSRVPFYLYVPVHTYDVARRFCESHQAAVTEIWTYRPAADGFDLVRSFHDAGAPARRPAKGALGPVAKVVPPVVAKPAPPPPAPKPLAKAAAKPAAKAPARPAAKPAAKADTKAAKPAPKGKPVAKPAAKKPAKAKAAAARKR
jgi:pyruvate/2-oxoglutarate dehydrogenase complex dihydrolipoamide acyltransferase (E2) component